MRRFSPAMAGCLLLGAALVMGPVAARTLTVPGQPGLRVSDEGPMCADADNLPVTVLDTNNALESSCPSLNLGLTLTNDNNMAPHYVMFAAVLTFDHADPDRDEIDGSMISATQQFEEPSPPDTMEKIRSVKAGAGVLAELNNYMGTGVYCPTNPYVYLVLYVQDPSTNMWVKLNMQAFVVKQCRDQEQGTEVNVDIVATAVTYQPSSMVFGLHELVSDVSIFVNNDLPHEQGLNTPNLYQMQGVLVYFTHRDVSVAEPHSLAPRFNEDRFAAFLPLTTSVPISSTHSFDVYSAQIDFDTAGPFCGPGRMVFLFDWLNIGYQGQAKIHDVDIDCSVLDYEVQTYRRMEVFPDPMTQGRDASVVRTAGLSREIVKIEGQSRWGGSAYRMGTDGDGDHVRTSRLMVATRLFNQHPDITANFLDPELQELTMLADQISMNPMCAEKMYEIWQRPEQPGNQTRAELEAAGCTDVTKLFVSFEELEHASYEWQEKTNRGLCPDGGAEVYAYDLRRFAAASVMRNWRECHLDSVHGGGQYHQRIDFPPNNLGARAVAVLMGGPDRLRIMGDWRDEMRMQVHAGNPLPCAANDFTKAIKMPPAYWDVDVMTGRVLRGYFTPFSQQYCFRTMLTQQCPGCSADVSGSGSGM